MVREGLVNGPPTEVYAVFLKDVWWKGGFPWIITVCLKTYEIQAASDPETGVGGIRQVPTYLQEEILSGSKGEYLEYHLRRKAWLPLKFHHGRVVFAADGESRTKVTWTVKYTPFFCMGWFVTPLLAVMLGWFFIPELRKACRKSHPRPNAAV
jgi:hypothetical protein